MTRSQEYERALQDYKAGTLSFSRFKSYYSTLRESANYRIKSSMSGERYSRALSQARVFNLTQTSNKSELFASGRELGDELSIEIAYRNALKFYTSEFSTSKGYRQSLDRIKSDFEESDMIPKSFDVTDEFAKFVASGDFAELVKILGNSPKVFQEIMKELESGVDAQSLIKAFDDFIAGGSEAAYDVALEEARNYAQNRSNRKGRIDIW